MTWLWWTIGGLVAWHVVGAMVLAIVDDEHLSLLHWAQECPIGSWVVVTFWPIVAALTLWRRFG